MRHCQCNAVLFYVYNLQTILTLATFAFARMESPCDRVLLIGLNYGIGGLIGGTFSPRSVYIATVSTMHTISCIFFRNSIVVLNDRGVDLLKIRDCPRNGN